PVPCQGECMADFLVREARPEDAAGIIAHVKRVADEPNNGLGMSSAADFRFTEAEEIEFIQKAAQADNALMLVAEADGKIIGMAHCGSGERGYAHTASLGITVDRAWRDKGVGTALLEFMIDWCRESPGVHRLELWVFPDNPRALHVYEKLGFQHEGNRRSSYLKDGTFKDLILMGMVFER
ncbi:MAG: GNAT family N-acetyltransferase, partial [Anaerolineae bacterium]|nr:GNAT family N-acetyltransferase [Anaerolineae bacterium]